MVSIKDRLSAFEAKISETSERSGGAGWQKVRSSVLSSSKASAAPVVRSFPVVKKTTPVPNVNKIKPPTKEGAGATNNISTSTSSFELLETEKKATAAEEQPSKPQQDGSSTSFTADETEADDDDDDSEYVGHDALFKEQLRLAQQRRRASMGALPDEDTQDLQEEEEPEATSSVSKSLPNMKEEATQSKSSSSTFEERMRLAREREQQRDAITPAQRSPVRSPLKKSPLGAGRNKLRTLIEDRDAPELSIRLDEDDDAKHVFGQDEDSDSDDEEQYAGADAVFEEQLRLAAQRRMQSESQINNTSHISFDAQQQESGSELSLDLASQKDADAVFAKSPVRPNRRAQQSSMTVLDQTRMMSSSKLYTGDMSFTSFDDQIKMARQREMKRRREEQMNKSPAVREVANADGVVSLRERMKQMGLK